MKKSKQTPLYSTGTCFIQKPVTNKELDRFASECRKLAKPINGREHVVILELAQLLINNKSFLSIVSRFNIYDFNTVFNTSCKAKTHRKILLDLYAFENIFKLAINITVLKNKY